MLPSGNDAAYELAIFVGKKFFQQELENEAEEIENVGHKTAVKYFI